MKFTIDQVKEAHAKVKSGADFPKYVQELIHLGMAGYTVDITKSTTTYTDTNGDSESIDVAYESTVLNEKLNMEQFTQRLKLHQQGGTDYKTFCNDCLENGVAGWTLTFKEMTCIYFDVANNNVLLENIPSA